MSISSFVFDKRYGQRVVDPKITTRNKSIQILSSQINLNKVKWLEVSKHWKVQIKQEIETQSELHKQFPNNIMGINDWCEDSDVVNKLQVKIAYQCPDDALPILDYLQNKLMLSADVKLDLTEKILFIGYVLFQLDVQHFNIKPNNLIYSEKKNIILLTDFGSARTHHYTYSVDPSSNLERKWQMNCWFYCSKQMLEILDNDFREIEFQRVNSNKQSSKELYANNDRWALGIILIQMFITLKQPDSIQEFPALNNKVIDDCLKKLEPKPISEAISQLLKFESTPKQIYEQFQKNRLTIGTTDEPVTLSAINPSQQQLMQIDKHAISTKNKTQQYYISKTEVMKLERVLDEIQQTNRMTHIENTKQEFQQMDRGELNDFDKIEDDSEIKNISAYSSQGADTKQLIHRQSQVEQVIDLSKINQSTQNQQPINNYKPEAVVLKIVQDTSQQLPIVVDTKKEQKLLALAKQQKLNAEYLQEAQKLTRIADQELEKKFIRFTETPKCQNMLTKVELPLLKVDKLDQYNKTLSKLSPQTVQHQNEINSQLILIEEATNAQIQLNKFVGQPTEQNYLNAQQLSKLSDSLKVNTIIKLESQLKKVQEQQRAQIQRQLEAIKESIVESKRNKFVDNPNPVQLIQGPPLHEMTDRNKQDYKQVLQGESEKQYIFEKKKIISHQIELIDESDSLQTQLNNFINNPKAEQLLSVWQLNMLTDEQSKQYQQALEKFQQEHQQQGKITEQQTQLANIKDIRSKLNQLINNPQPGIYIDPIKLAYLNQCELEYNRNILQKVDNATDEQKKAQSQCSVVIDITIKAVLSGQQIVNEIIYKQITEQITEQIVKAFSDQQVKNNSQPTQSKIIQNEQSGIKQPSQIVESNNVKKVIQKVEQFHQSPSESLLVTAEQMSQIKKDELIRLKELLQQNKPNTNDKIKIVNQQLQEINNAIERLPNTDSSQLEKNKVKEQVKDFLKYLSHYYIVDEQNLSVLSNQDLQEIENNLQSYSGLNPNEDADAAVKKQINIIQAVMLKTQNNQEQIFPINDTEPSQVMPVGERDNNQKQDSSSLDSAFFAQLHSTDFQYIFSENPIISRFQKWRQYTQHIFNPFTLSNNKSVIKHKDLAGYNSNLKNREIIQEQNIKISGYTKDNKLHGLGMMMRLKKYGIYEGIFEEGKFLWGAVLELNPEGQVTYYVGPYDLMYQAKHGKCYLQWYKEGPQSQFRLAEQHDGIIIIGLFEGKGKRVKYDLQTNEVIEEYVGEWKRNHKHGHGDYKYKVNGQENRYVGEFQNDMYHGQGTFYLQPCIYQIGPYRNNKPTGKHILYKKKLESDAEGVKYKELSY